MWSKHRFMNALIRNGNARFSLARFANSIDKDLLAHSSLLPYQRVHQWPSERYVNTYSRRFFSDSTEVCATIKTIFRLIISSHFFFNCVKIKLFDICHFILFHSKFGIIFIANTIKTHQPKVCFLRFDRTAGVSSDLNYNVVCLCFCFILEFQVGLDCQSDQDVASADVVDVLSFIICQYVLLYTQMRCIYEYF